MVLPILVGVVLAVVVIYAIRRPVLRRLAVRDAARRPSETALVVLGSLLGTALITGSFIVGDTLDSSIRATAKTKLGPIDEVVAVPSEKLATRVASRIEALDDPRIDGVMTALGVRAAFASEASGRQRAEPTGQLLEVDFQQATSFGGDPAATGISGSGPRPGELVITEDLAAALDAGPGHEITSYLYGKESTFRIARVVPTWGVAGFWTGFGNTSPNAFVSPGTIREIAGRRVPPAALPPTPSVLVSNRGDVEGGAALTDEVTEAIEGTLGAAPARVEEIKQDVLDAAEAEGKEFGELFVAIGSFAIVAGILLLVNIFVMLAEERKGQLGMLRAIGMKRSFLVSAFIIEGAMYSLASAILGAALGVGVGWAIVKLAAPIFGGFDDFALDLIFTVSPESIVIGFCSGLLISLVTIAGTSFRISRVNIIRAIRSLPEPLRDRAKLRTVIVGVVVALLALVAFAGSANDEKAWASSLMLPPIAAFAFLPLASRFLPRRAAVIGAASIGLVWGIFGDAVLGGRMFRNGDVFAFVLQGVLLTFCAVVLLTQLQETIAGIFTRIAGRNLPLRLSLAYPLARRVRTGLTLGMFALVIFTMTFIAVLSNVFGGQVETATAKEGKFDLLATANGTNPPQPRDIASVSGVAGVATLFHGVALFESDAFPEPQSWPASGVDETFVEGGPPILSDRLPELDSDADAWRMILEDSSTMLVPVFFLQGGGPGAGAVKLGDVVPTIDPQTGRTVDRKVVGIVDGDMAFSGAYMSKESLREVLGRRAAPVRFYVKTAGDEVQAREVAADLQGRFVENGVEADTFRTIVEEQQQLSLQFMRLMEGYLALGLLVGIAGLGVVMVRAVRERRREIGVLRSLGFLGPSVRRSFLFESTFIALQGILIGAILALITAAQLIATDAFGESANFTIPWDDLLILCGAALIASLLATAWPAQQASKVPPAVALRVAE